MYPLKLDLMAGRASQISNGIIYVGCLVAFPEWLSFKAKPFCFNNNIYYHCENILPQSFSTIYAVV